MERDLVPKSAPKNDQGLARACHGLLAQKSRQFGRSLGHGSNDNLSRGARLLLEAPEDHGRRLRGRKRPHHPQQ
eukprot:5655319-Prymnesium_polylepis.1